MLQDLMNIMNPFVVPQLSMVVEPETKIRFRYISERGSHGALTGKQKEGGKKTYPTLKLENYLGNKPVFIRVSLYTEDEKKHVFEFKGKKTEEVIPYIEEYVEEDGTVKFTNLRILCKTKGEIETVLMNQKLKNLKEDISEVVKKQLEKKYSKEVKERAKTILNSLKLYFEAFEENNPIPLCSLFSDTICNQKSASKGELKIHRISKCSGTWRGGEEVILLCDKVDKGNIRIRFFETDACGSVIWEKCAEFSPADVHYQVAITFKTPAYKANVEKDVFVCLEREDEKSEPRTFTYKREDVYVPTKKRKIVAEQSVPEVKPEPSPESSMSISSPEYCSNETSLDRPSILESQSDANDDSQILIDITPYFPCDGIAEGSVTMEEILNVFEDYPLSFDGLLDENMDEPLPLDNIDGTFVPTSDFKGNGIGMDVLNLEKQMAAIKIIDREGTKSASNKDSRKELGVTKYAESDLHENKQLWSDFLSKRDDLGNTLLHMAVYKNKNVASVLKINLITKSDIIDVQNCRKETALHIATKNNKTPIVKILLRNGSNPSIKNAEGNNCFHIAAQNNSVSAMHCLLSVPKQMCGINAFNYDGLTPLHIAVKNNAKYCFDLLKLHHADINLVEQKGGRSLLHFAVEFQPSFVSVLLKEGEINVNVQDFQGNTPLHIACATENVDAVKKLLQAGASPFLTNFKQNCNMLEEGNSEDDTHEGQTPADITTNLEILEILRGVECPLNLQNCNCFNEPSKTTNQSMEKLYHNLDNERRWKEIACYFIDENFLDILDCSDSPTKALLEHIKREHQDSYLETFKTVLEIAGLWDAVKIIEECLLS